MSDFRFGLREYVGPAMGFPLISFIIKDKGEGEYGVVLPIWLPLLAVGSFRQEVKKMAERPTIFEFTQAHVKITSIL